MRAHMGTVLVALLCGTAVSAGCRALQGLGDLQYDLGADAGAGSGGTRSGTGGGTGGDAAARDAGGRDGSAHDGSGGAGSGGAGSGGAGSGGAGSGGSGSGGAGSGGGATCAPAGYTCGAPPPAGWSGPIAVYEGLPGTTPGCPSDYPTPALGGGTGLDAGPATCAACVCSTPAVTCGATPLAEYWYTNCSGSQKTLSLSPGTCASIEQGDGYVAGTPDASADPCQPSGGDPAVPPLAWASEGVACALAGQGTTCADGSLCAPTAASPFAPQWCIWQEGVQSCPPEFPQQHVWQTATDTRACTPCACGSPTGAACTATTKLYGDPNCNTPVLTLTAGHCNQQGMAQAAMSTTSPSGTPSCPASGGAPTGLVVATSATILLPEMSPPARRS